MPFQNLLVFTTSGRLVTASIALRNKHAPPIHCKIVTTDSEPILQQLQVQKARNAEKPESVEHTHVHVAFACV